MNNIATCGGDIDFNDYYLVARNASNLRFQPSWTPVEAGFQFVGNQVILLRKRNLTGRELTDWQIIYVYTFFVNELVVIGFSNITSAFEVDDFNYGSIMANNLIAPTSNSFLLGFLAPQSTSKQTADRYFEWSYVNDDGNNTIFTIFQYLRGAPNNLAVQNFFLSGSWQIKTDAHD